MKKVCLVVCFAMLLGMLAGCQTQLPDHTTQQPATTEDIHPLPSKNPGSSLIEDDSDRQIYIGTENIYMDYYLGITGAPCLNIPVYSKVSLGRDDYGGLGHFMIKLYWDTGIELDMMLYWIEVTQVELQRKTEYMAGENDESDTVMPYYVYQAYRGGNVTALANAKIGYKPDNNMTDPLRADFEALTVEDLPEFYVYNLRVYFTEIPEPEKGKPITLEKLQLTVNGQTYEGKFGSVRFFNREDCKPKVNSTAVPEYGGVFSGSYSELYNDGLIRILRLCVVDNFQLDYKWADPQSDYAWMCGVWMLDEGSKVLDAYMSIKDKYGNYRTFSIARAVNNEYDGDSVVYSGESLYVDVVIENEHADKLLSNIHLQIAVEWAHCWIEDTPYEPINTYIPYCDIYTFVCTPSANHYENYAILFDGVDMEQYYAYYLDTYQPWRKDYLR